MTVLFVIPVNERLTKGSCILNGAESVRKLGAVFERLKLGFRIRIVIAHMGTTMGFCDTHIRKEMGNNL
jgi:hypothetical protein